MFKGLGKSLGDAFNQVSREVDRAVDDVSRSVDHHRASPLLDQFRTGNVVQLISRSSGQAVQIVTNSAGQLVIDGKGPENATAYHAHWTVINDGSNIVRLYNNNNFLAIVNGAVVLGNFPDHARCGMETRLRLHQTSNFITLESKTETGRHIGILNNGDLKSAIATGKEVDAQFGVRLVYSPYPPPGVATAPPPQGTTVVTTTTYSTKKK